MSLVASWRNSGYKAEEVAVSTRMRLARNLRHHRFPAMMDKEEALEIENEVARAAETLPENYYHQPLRDMDKSDARVLMERHLISPELIKNQETSAYFLREDERVNLLVNEEDHLRLQVLTGGFALEDTYALALNTDDALEKELNYAFDPGYGYLTACPTNVGTGLRASVMIFLPGIVANKQLKGWIDSLAKLGVIVRGIYGEGSLALGDMYQISNQHTLGFSEEQVVEKLSSMVENLMEEERDYREKIVQRKGKLWIEDRVYRSLGILSFSRTITEQEAIDHLSNLRLGICLGVYHGKTLSEIDHYMFQVQKYSMTQYGKKLGLDSSVGEIRGRYLRNSFQEVI